MTGAESGKQEGETGGGDVRLSGLLHDVRHSLHVVRIGLGLMKESNPDNPRITEVCELMENEVRRIGALLDQMVVSQGAALPSSGPKAGDEMAGDQPPEA